MLPTHVLADVVGFLHLYDLDAVLLADSRCSDLAVSAASHIRVFDFSEYGVGVYKGKIVIYNVADQRERRQTELEFLDETELVDFIPGALRNTVLGSLSSCYKASHDPIREVAHTIVVKGTLSLYAYTFANVQALVEFAASFRSIQSVLVRCSPSQIDKLMHLFDRHGFGFGQLEIQPATTYVSFVNRSV